MTPCNFKESNASFGPPKGTEESPLQNIPVHIGKGEDGSKIYITCWQPSEKERLNIASGLPVYVTFVETMPQHYVSAPDESL